MVDDTSAVCLVKRVEALLKVVSLIIFPYLSIDPMNVWNENEEESIQLQTQRLPVSLLFISIHALNHILGYRLRSLGDAWLIAV